MGVMLLAMMQGTFAPFLELPPLLALLLSAVGTLIVGSLAYALRRRAGGMPVAGLLLAGSAMVALAQVRPAAAITAGVGVAILVLGGALTDLGLRSFAMRVATALPGAWLIAFNTIPAGSSWVPWLVLAAIAIGGPLVADFGRDGTNATWGPPLLAMTAIGIFFTVPDTEEAAVLVTAAVPVVLLGWPTRLARLGGAGSYASVGVVMWVTAWGGVGREASVIGATACFGLLMVVPLVRIITSRNTLVDRLGSGTPAMLVIGAIHFLVVIFASRVAGLRADVTEASLLAFLALGSAALLVTFIKPESILTDTGADASEPEWLANPEAES